MSKGGQEEEEGVICSELSKGRVADGERSQQEREDTGADKGGCALGGPYRWFLVPLFFLSFIINLIHSF